MWNEKFTYLVLMLGSLSFPFIFSFEKNIRFYKYWNSLLFSILIPGVFFIVWDVIFTYLGFWSFNDSFILGPRFFGLPIEEWLFFVIIPYCSLFIYEVIKYYFKSLDFNRFARISLQVIGLIFLTLAFINFGKWYTFINLLCNALFLSYIVNAKSFQKHLSHFVLAFLIACLPMLLVNGVLTSMPVVLYSDQFFSNIRLFNIPIEDFSYFLLLMSMNVFVYEKTKQQIVRKNANCSQ